MSDLTSIQIMMSSYLILVKSLDHNLKFGRGGGGGGGLMILII